MYVCMYVKMYVNMYTYTQRKWWTLDPIYVYVDDVSIHVQKKASGPYLYSLISAGSAPLVDADLSPPVLAVNRKECNNYDA